MFRINIFNTFLIRKIQNSQFFQTFIVNKIQESRVKILVLKYLC